MNLTEIRWLAFEVTLAAFLFSLPCPVRADALDNWTVIQVSTNSFQLSHVVYGNGRFVAAGGRADGGAIMSSEDGLRWTLRADGGFQGSPALIWDLAYGDGTFMTVGLGGAGGVSISNDGTNWSYTTELYRLYGVAYGDGAFVVVGEPDASSKSIFLFFPGFGRWPADTDTNDRRTVYDVAYGAGRFVAVAEGGYSYTSADGSYWTRRLLPGEVRNIGFCNGKFFAPYGSGTNLVSRDGIDWAVLGTGVPGAFGRMGFAGGMFVGFTGGLSGVSWARWGYTNLVTSLDGTNWVHRGTYPFYSDEDSEDSAFEIATDGRRFITVGAIRPGPAFFNNNAFVAVSDPITDIGFTAASPPAIILSGLVGRTYRVEYLPSLPASVTNPWQTLTNLILPSSPYLLADPGAPNSSQRYYRAVLLP